MNFRRDKEISGIIQTELKDQGSKLLVLHVKATKFMLC